MLEVGKALMVLSPEQLSFVESTRVVILNGDIGPLSRAQQQALCTFVERGGGLVCLGDTIEAYDESELFGEMLGDVHGFCTPRSEIIARVATPDHYITRRVDASFAVLEACYLLAAAPSGAQVLWQTSWQYAIHPLAYVYNYGRGRIFCTTLGSAPETQEHAVFAQIVARAIRYVGAEDTPERTANVAMIGYGAIGYEHGTAVSNVPGLAYTLVCDRKEERLQQAQQAFPGVRTCTDLDEVAADPLIDVVIVSTPPNTHAAITMQMLRAGKHVVSEKPFCLTTAEADAMIHLANEVQRTLTVYQCRRWDPDYLAIQQVIKRNTIGPIFHLEMFVGGYAHPCDYWHSHEPISGGVFYDWGSHYLDWILNLIPDPVVSVRGSKHKRVWHDVTNADQSSVYLRFAGGQEATFMHSDIAAALKPKWYILGEHGAIVGNRRQSDALNEEYPSSSMLPDLHVFTPAHGSAVDEQYLALPPRPLYAFHRNLANHLHSGEPLAVKPEEARRNIAIMEAAKYSAEHSGETIALNC